MGHTFFGQAPCRFEGCASVMVDVKQDLYPLALHKSFMMGFCIVATCSTGGNGKHIDSSLHLECEFSVHLSICLSAS